MFVFIAKTFATTASFRIPESHTFQQTLPLPPITTLTGLMGAALGLGFGEAMKFRQQMGILFGVIGTNRGEMRDLWKYNKLETDKREKQTLIQEFLTDLETKLEKGTYPIFRKDVLIREFLTNVALTIAIGCRDKATLLKVKDSFCNPKYALSAGNSDDLLKVCSIGNLTEVKEERWSDFENTVLPGNQTFQYESMIDLKNTPVTYKIKAPQVFLLPTEFSFDGEERRVSRREQFTFVGSPIRLKDPIHAYRIDDFTVAML